MVYKGWVQAVNLAPGDEIVDYNDGTPLTVVSVAYEETTERVYNFEVSGTHTYFAGDVGAWVHNASKFQRGVAGAVAFGLAQGGGLKRATEFFSNGFEFIGSRAISRNTSCPLPDFPFEGTGPKPKTLGAKFLSPQNVKASLKKLF